MYPAPENVASPRFARLAQKLADKSYRDSYVSSQMRTWLADQVRALRGGMSQKEFGQLIGKPQTVVSRLEDPDYGRLTLETLLDVASKLDIALLVRFVDYTTFLTATNDFSEAALRPAPYNQEAINNLALQSPVRPTELYAVNTVTTIYAKEVQFAEFDASWASLIGPIATVPQIQPDSTNWYYGGLSFAGLLPLQSEEGHA